MKPIDHTLIEQTAAKIRKALEDAIPSGRNDSFVDLSESTKTAWCDIAARAVIGSEIPLLAPEREVVFYEGLFESACKKIEEKYQKTDDNSEFHDVGALRAYLYDFLLFYISTLPVRELGNQG